MTENPCNDESPYTIYLVYSFSGMEEAENFIDKYEIKEPVDIRYKLNEKVKEKLGL